MRGKSTKVAETNELRAAVDHLFERRSVLLGHEILAEGLNQGLGLQDLEELKRGLADQTCGLVDLVDSQRNPHLSSEFAILCGLQMEEWCRDFINRTRSKSVPAVIDFDAALARLNMPELTGG